MCGLIGSASTEKLKNRAARKSFMFEGILLNAAARGMESSGLALVHDTDRNPTIYKKAMWGGDFLMHAPVQAYLNDLEKYPVVLGHVRAATSGRGNITDYNAHPFQYDHITFVHNGHIRNANSLPHSSDAHCAVDSAMVAYSMAKNGEKETLEQVEGGFVFIWWNHKTKTLNIARNEERPLHFAFIEKENSMYWSSDILGLQYLLRHENVDEEKGIVYPGVYNWYQFKLDNLRSFTKVPFEKRPPWRNQIGNRGHNHGPYRGMTGGIPANVAREIAEWGEWESTEDSLCEIETLHGRDTTNSPSTTDGTSEVDEIRNEVSLQRCKDAKRNGIPTSEKRIKRATEELGKLGIDFKQVRIISPWQWIPYHNQKNFGSILGNTKAENHLVEVVNVSHTDWDFIKGRPGVAVQCCNIKGGPDGKPRVVGVLDETFLSRQKAQKLKVEEANRQTVVLPSGSIDRNMDGPNGQKISYDRWKELTTNGCANCQRYIPAEMHGTVIWVGSPPSPICNGCNTPEILETLGFPDHLRQAAVH